MRVSVRNPETGNVITMEVDQDHTMEDIIETAANQWGLAPGAYVLKHGKDFLQGQLEIYNTGIRDGDMIELIPDPTGG
ncbi:MAG: hypothetical protein ACE5K0_09610 [Candidatus Methanofastidiosia archaeon]